MTRYSARGTCNKCGKFTEASGADEADAHAMLYNSHGVQHKHCFDGEIVVVKIDDDHSKR